jgi:BMFP domain-containing protein YqiC
MQSNPFLDDLSKMASSAATNLLEMRHEVERMVQAQFEKLADKMNFVSREEFEVVREMAQKAREENAELRKELEALKKPAAKKTTKAKSAPKKTAKASTKKSSS